MPTAEKRAADPILVEWRVHLGDGVLIQSELPDIADHTDNRRP